MITHILKSKVLEGSFEGTLCGKSHVIAHWRDRAKEGQLLNPKTTFCKTCKNIYNAEQTEKKRILK